MQHQSEHARDQGISLIEVVVSMVILSVVLASMASLVLSNVGNFNRSIEGLTAANMAQDAVDRLLAAPVHTWAFDAHGNVKKDVNANFATVGGYKIERKIEPVNNIYELTDACDTVIGKTTDASDLVKVTVSVTPYSIKHSDRYTTTLLLSRNEESLVAESSLTVRFNVAKGDQRISYSEAQNGGPVRVTVNQGMTDEQTAVTRNGCVTFVGLKRLEATVQFATKNYTESLSQKSDVRERVQLVKGGNRLVEYDLVGKRELAVIPQLKGQDRVSCDTPRLMRIRTPLGVGPNRAVRSLREIAAEGKAVEDNLRRTDPRYLDPVDKARLEAASRWQYYMVCQDFTTAHGRQYPISFLLPDTIPVSLVEENGGHPMVTSLVTWADADFNKRPYPNVQEADWPVVTLPTAKQGSRQRLFVGSCLMSGTEASGALVDVNKAQNHWKADQPKAIHLPMWHAPIDGIDDPGNRLNYFNRSVLRETQNSYPLVIKNVYDNGDQSRFGDHYVRSSNLRQYAGCKDTPVFHAGWIKTYSYHSDRAQLHLLLPFGLYSYASFAHNDVEVNELGNTVTKSRHTCTPACGAAWGERSCIRSGAKDLTLYHADGRTVPALAENNWTGSFNHYVAWHDRTLDGSSAIYGNTYLAPRGPIIQGCAAY